MRELAPGLYEKIITDHLAAALHEPQVAELADRRGLDSDETPDLLAGHIAALLRRALRSRRIKDDVTEQINLANRIAHVINEVVPDSADAEDLISTSEELLLAIADKRTPDGVAQFPNRPESPLSSSALLVNAHGQPSVGHELERELASADRVDLICAFVRWHGVRILDDALAEFVRRGGRLRVITTTYLGSTERKALDRLAEIGAEIKVSYETRTTRLHAKAWLFGRETGFSTAYVGSSNLSKAALIDGLEWNVRLSAVEQPHLLDTIGATFEDYWADPSFEPYDPNREDDRKRLAEALETESGGPRDLPVEIASIDVHPYGYQREVLEELDAERRIHDRWRNLVVMATGTGKTVVAALDFRRLLESNEVNSLLFVAHREEILTQSRRVFRQVLRDTDFGEMYVNGQRPEQWRHVFASVQSLHQLDLANFDPSTFDMVIVDEFHHSEAPTYSRLLDHLKLRVLLGLTATPERTDGQDIKHWFGGRIAAELRLWEAIGRQLLSPFQYFGVYDEVDVAGVPWRRGQGYDLKQLSEVYTGNDERVRMIIATLRRTVGDVTGMRALGFCVSIDHAEYMAAKFEAAGITAVAITSQTLEDERKAHLRDLRTGTVNAVFTVDLFNEGVDVPAIDTVLFLRPTDSATVFLQQLGRGLRLADNKPCLTVLDFIGNQNRNFRFDRKLGALTGAATRTEVRRDIESSFPQLPAGCHVDLDREVSQLVLRNIRDSLALNWPELARELEALPPEATLAEFIDATGIELGDLYRSDRRGWADLRRVAQRGGAAGPDDRAIARALGRWLHVDDRERLDLMVNLPLAVVDVDDERQRRLLAMLDVHIWGGTGAASDLEARLARLHEHSDRVAEVRELAAVLDERRHRVTTALPGDVPLHVHGTYSKNEALAAFGEQRPAHIREGVRYVEGENADVFFVTIDKATNHYSPTTMYEDRAITPTLFQWESQSTLRQSAVTAQRYMSSESSVHLFIRQSKRDEGFGAPPYLYAGTMQYVSCEGDRPVRFKWELDHPLPADVFNYARVTAA